MVKAMHDRQLLTTTRTGKKRTARNRGRAGLSPRDRKVLQRSAHFARFAAASYDGVVDTVKDLVAEGEVSRPPNLLYQRCGGIRHRSGGLVVLARSEVKVAVGWFLLEELPDFTVRVLFTALASTLRPEVHTICRKPTVLKTNVYRPAQSVLSFCSSLPETCVYFPAQNVPPYPS